MKDNVKEYLKQFKSNKEKYHKDLESWTEEELKEHYKEVDAYYGRSIRTDNLLGRFNDKENHYHWHTIDQQNSSLLEHRLGIGYSIVDDISEVGMKRSQDPAVLGNSLSVGSGDKAILLRIPQKLYELNQKIKHAKSNKKSLFDHNGNPLKFSVKEGDKSRTVFTDAGLTKPYEVDNSQLL